MTDIVVEAEVLTSAYEYEGTLGYGTNYFWQVTALEPVPSDWSATFSFRTEATPAPPPQAPQVTPLWGWVIIAIGVILDISLFILILRRRST